MTPVAPPDIWRDPANPPAVRAEALLAVMTIDEKIGQMTQLQTQSVDPAGAARLLLGSVLTGGDGGPAGLDADSWYDYVAAYERAALETRLGIPILFGIDAIHGNNKVVGATIFPHNVALGAVGDERLVERIARATALELVAVGIRWTFAPVLAVPQDVRWGRTYEGFGESTELVTRLSTAHIRGLQGDDLTADDAVAATAKHFVGDGGTAWGSSTFRTYSIDQGVTYADEATMRAVHLAPYPPAIAAGVPIVMATFSGTPAGKVHGDRRLLTDVLKRELGFDGFVISDWAGVDQVAPDFADAVAQSIGAGMDMVMVPNNGKLFRDVVLTGLAAGTIERGRIDDAVRRILRVKFALGLFERPIPAAGRTAVVGCAEHRALAREAVARSAVLLRTEPTTLPVRDGETVLLAGPAADDMGRQCGGWTINWHGKTGPVTPGTTIAAALRARLAERMVEDDGASDVRADVGIVVVGEFPYAEGGGDSATLALPADEIELVRRIRPRVDRLVVVVLSGRPVMLDGIVDTADAVVAAWLPGTEGAGVADVLLGDRPFTGTTPYTWPLRPETAPRTGRQGCDGARFPFGYGLRATGELLGPAPCPEPGP
jgi:beta-glucosidase